MSRSEKGGSPLGENRSYSMQDIRRIELNAVHNLALSSTGQRRQSQNRTLRYTAEITGADIIDLLLTTTLWVRLAIVHAHSKKTSKMRYLLCPGC